MAARMLVLGMVVLARRGLRRGRERISGGCGGWKRWV